MELMKRNPGSQNICGKTYKMQFLNRSMKCGLIENENDRKKTFIIILVLATAYFSFVKKHALLNTHFLELLLH